jgi:uncharacterized protein Yka (UPF0111/DUF47 family)
MREIQGFTPLDRGDIKDLITSMDDAIDQMNQTAKVITLFELCSFKQSMLQRMSPLFATEGSVLPIQQPTK